MLSKIFKQKQKPGNTKSISHLDIGGFTEYMSESSVASAASYKNNVVVYRCVNVITQSASHVLWVLYKNKGNSYEKLHNHPLHKLLNQPNFAKAGADFFAEVIASLLLFGNSYILSSVDDLGAPQELYMLHAKQTEVVMSDGVAIGYRHHHAKGDHFYPISRITSNSRVLHLKTYNPSDSVYGLSCLEAASMPIEIHSSASKWNSSLLRNGARPSGALIMKDSSGYLSDEQFSRLKEQLYDKYLGSSNAGKPLLLEGGLDWREMSISPKDMDFIESKNSAAREIALAFGVPPTATWH